MAIKFYRERDLPYGVFSNFAKSPFELDGHEWKTVEHYFQAQKLIGTPLFEVIRDSPAPRDAKLLGNSREYELRKDWELVKDAVMKEGVYAKFHQNTDMRAVLLSTGDEDIIEEAINDSYWGTGPGGTGKNMLGNILVEVRAQLRSEG